MKYILFFTLILFSCRNYNDRPDPAEVQALETDQAAEANKRLVKEESEQIDEFNLRHHFIMKMTGTGLRYNIYSHGKGSISPVMHDEVQISYRLFFLDGTLCTQTDSLHPLTFRLGEGVETRGLEEGLMMMKEGDKARLVVPAHLAFGLTGDGNKIPPASTLFYDVQLLKLKK